MHQLDFIGTLLQAKVKNRVFLKLESRYIDYFTEYSNYFGRALRLLKSMYSMTKYGNLFADYLTECFIDAVLFNLNVRCLYIINMNQTEQRLLFYLMLMTVSIGILLKLLKMVFENLRKRFHLKFLGYAHWSTPIRIYQMRENSISVNQNRYDTSIVAKYLDTDTFKTSNFFIRRLCHTI